ncbi:non-ribosomal peptide synthetase [Amycolatopsis benzoatilytica]|uniref:Non-ribosomal peptide synthetase n=1 Tax=Amycolatopsis benzoatilytica TaxID=346045 RepID=A0A6G6D0D5_9PSEU|nr:non-ribosomal peptide synthetase [Amycolatopsis benzoatilytica]QIE08755.1 non-ribosomal peptide synthetase [Amycolatopsis benzoatilytica]
MSSSVEDVLPLTPLQQGMVFHALLGDRPDVYTVQTVLDLTEDVEPDRLRAAAEALVRRHGPLRAAFRTQASGQFVQVIRRSVEVPFRVADRLDLDADRAEPFDLGRPPLLRFTLCGRTLVLTAHHLLWDGWSAPILVRELLALYRGERLPPVRPFRDHLTWLSKQDTRAAEDAWRSALSGLAEPTLIGGGTSGFPCRSEFRFPAAALEQTARRHGVTLNAIVQSAWALTLAAMTGRDDLVFGATVSGRSGDLPDAESMVGMFINTVPVRVRLSGSESLTTLAARVQTEQARLLEHDHLGLADIQRASGHPNLFDTLLVFESYPMDEAIPLLAGVSVRDSTHYPLALLVVPGDDLTLRIDHDRTQCPDATPIAERFQQILRRFAVTPELPVAQLDVLTEAEHDALATPNSTHADVPATTLAALFEAQARRTPDAEAVRFDTDSLTYRELDAQASALATGLAAAGVGPDRIVGVRHDRSLDLVVSLLAVLKAGGAYLPLDPSYPAERLDFMREDAQPAVVLPAALHGSAPITPASPDNAAYVIYTSGSTGRPKGVVVTHRAIVNRLLWMQHQYRLTAQDRVLQKTPASFDVSVWEFFWPLITGAVLVLAKPGGHQDPDYLADLIARERITTVHFVPSMLRAYGDRPLPRRVITSGEALPTEIARPGMHNLYGPTETAVDVTHHTVTDEVAIGVPVWNTTVHVLDPVLRPVAPGVPGELYLGGVQLARGYLNRPGLTASRFVAAPDGQRLYRTGDVVQWENGALHYLGRTDDQVKIRGFRVELGAIEAALTAQPGVRAAAVTVRAGQQQLVGYVVTDPGVTVDLAALGLPEHEIPAVLVPLGKLPLTPSGKLDRNALPEPQFQTGEAQARDPREEIVCEVFADVLGLDRVSRADDFFALGGHSLLATRLISRLRRTFGVDLSLRAVFDAPTPARLARLLDGGNRRAPLTKQPRPSEIPLSAAQRSLWFLYQVDGPTTTYNLPFAARLTGPLDTAALAAALLDVVTRHEALRTIFPGDRSGQEILAPRPLARGGTDHAFRLDEELPIRYDLRRTGPDEHEFTLVVHHIAADEWSARPLLRDLARAYAARIEGSAPEWPPLPVQYADYSLWQQQNSRDDIGYWSRQLADLPEELPLPTDRPRPPQPTGEAGSVRVELPDTRRLARRFGVTELMVGQAAVAVLLHRLGAGEDIPLGTPSAGRSDEALDDLVGCFVNTLVLRTDLSGSPTFRELLARVRETDLDAYAHQDTPFERVVEAVNPVRSPNRHPLFQTMVSHQAVRPTDLDLPGIAVTPLDPGVSGAKFDLAFHFGAGECAISYRTDLFDKTTVEAFGRRLATLLTAFAAKPELPVDLVDILDADDRARLAAFNNTDEDRPATTLTAMVEEQVARSPDAIAVEFHDVRLTYTELDARANHVAKTLRENGVGPEKTVGMHWERSVELVVGLLGVEKAGGAFVPLEPSWPAQRIAEVCESAALSAVLSGPEHDEPVRGLGVPVVHVGTESTPDRSTVAVDPEGLAYVIYTSGSTGKPKGAMIRHRAIAHRLLWQRELLGFGPGDASLFKAPLGFDISINEIFLPLVNGGKLVIAEPDGERDPDYLLGLIDRHSVTFTYLPSSILDLLLQLPGFGPKAGSLKHVWCGGEVLTPELFARFRRASDAIMYHGYGPAEATIGVSHVVYRDPEALRAAVSIGKPNGNTQLYVLDRRLLPVPVGVPGELYAAGIYLGRGYLGDPRRTAERFVANPFGPPGARLYRTGDLARWQADGSLEFLGRADNQIKIRGMRVEPEEIEAVLEQHEQVRRAVVLVRAEQPGLLGYCLGPETDGVGDWLRGRLPEHMVPQQFVFLDEFPLLPSGKVDRKALPAPPPEGTGSRAAVTATEKLLCELMAQLLKRDEIGAEDNFFALGGDSILSIRFVSGVRAAGFQLSPRQVFEHQTAAALARVLDATAAAVQHDDGTGEVPLTPIMRWWTTTGDITMHQAALLRVPAPFAPDAFEQVLQDVLDHHQLLRARLGDGVLHVPHTKQAQVEHVDGPYSAAKHAAVVSTLDPAESMLKAVAFDGRLLLVLHHLVVDGVSWRILTEDLATAWEARAAGRRPRLAPAPTSFRTWALATADQPEPSHGRALPVSGRTTIELTVEETRKVLENKHARVHETLLAALGSALGPLEVALEGHGREEQRVPGADLSRTVGWFTTIFPFALTGSVNDVKERLRAVPDHGFGMPIPDSEVSFNYLGRFEAGDGYWVPGPEKLPESAVQHRPLQIDALVEDGPVLKATWSFTDRYRPDEVARYARAWVRALSGGNDAGLTPSDVPLVSLKQGQLDKLAAKWGKK